MSEEKKLAVEESEYRYGKCFGVAQCQKRAHEDRFWTWIGKAGEMLYRYFVIFDGHGGSHMMSEKHVADYCVRNLHLRLESNLSKIDTANEELVTRTIKD